MTNSADRGGGRSQSAFTLVEMMIVVLIIGILLAISIYSFSIVRRSAQDMRFINDLRVAVAAFELYSLENSGKYPADRSHGVMPSGMVGYLSGMRWSSPTSMGGLWEWDKDQYGFTAGVSFFSGSVNMDARMAVIDRRIDDGDLLAGRFRKRDRGYIYVIEF